MLEEAGVVCWEASEGSWAYPRGWRRMGWLFGCMFHTSAETPPCNSPHPLRENSVRVRDSKKPSARREGRETHHSHERGNNAGKIHIHKKRPLSPSKHRGNKGVKQNVPVKRLRDGHWTSSACTPMSQSIVRRTTHKSSSQWIRAVSCHPPPQGTGPV